MAETTNLSGVVIRGAMAPGYEKVLTPEAVAFAVELERKFGVERQRLLARRAEIGVSPRSSELSIITDSTLP